MRVIRNTSSTTPGLSGSSPCIQPRKPGLAAISSRSSGERLELQCTKPAQPLAASVSLQPAGFCSPATKMLTPSSEKGAAVRDGMAQTAMGNTLVSSRGFTTGSGVAGEEVPTVAIIRGRMAIRAGIRT